MRTFRMFAPARAEFGPIIAVDIPEPAVATLVGAGWTKVALSGRTAHRPAANTDPLNDWARGDSVAEDGMQFFDTDLNKLIVFAAQAWRLPCTGMIV